MTESTEQLLQKWSFYADHAYVLVRRRCLLIAVWAVVLGLVPVALPAAARARAASAGAATTASPGGTPANDRDADHVDDERRYRNVPGIATMLDDHRIDASARNPKVAPGASP